MISANKAWPRATAFGAGLVLLTMCFFTYGQGVPGKKEPAKTAGSSAGAVDVEFVDGSVMKLTLRDEKIELETSYGKLLIPVADVKRIEFAQRITEETRKRIEAAINDLGSADFRRRQIATTELEKLKDKAYPALRRSANTKDTEVSNRIEKIMEKIRESVKAELLEIPAYDIVHTETSKIAGHVKAESLRVATLPFGEQQVKLADVRNLRLPMSDEPQVVENDAILDPGTFQLFQNQIGKTFSVRVTAPPVGMGMRMGVFGTDVYTTDSSLEAAAIHAGVLAPGKTAVIRVTIVGPQAGFQPSLRNGIASNAFGPWNGYRIEQPKGGAARKN